MIRAQILPKLLLLLRFEAICYHRVLVLLYEGLSLVAEERNLDAMTTAVIAEFINTTFGSDNIEL